MISNASTKVKSPGTQKHSRKGFIALSLFVVKYLLEMSRKIIGTVKKPEGKQAKNNEKKGS